MQLDGETATFCSPGSPLLLFHIPIWEKFANALNYCMTYESAQPSVVGGGPVALNEFGGLMKSCI